ncbi:MAG: integral rane protein [Candidatus Saccharibacteria bacterium]|jgi:uncharacterized membrane protein YbhN (UPF0104 family)|nr:integral rane protein [Candidatus Saccharibacteria bacterium]
MLVRISAVGDNEHSMPVKFSPKPRQLMFPLLALLGLYVLVPQFGSFHESLGFIRHAQATALIAAAVCTGLTYLAAAGTYYLIGLRQLRYWHTVLVQVASMFINRLLPAGIGALGANYAYLRGQKHTPAQAGAVVAVNNFLGLAGHVVLVIIIVSLYHDRLPPVHMFSVNHRAIWFGLLIVAVVLGLAFSVSAWRRRLRATLISFSEQLLNFRKRPWRLLGGLGSSMGLTLSNVLGLYFCLLAVHGSASFVMVLLVFTLGVGLGTATPTPGGLGGFEAGLVAGFIAYHVPSSQALAAALLYRLLSYWLAIGVGAIAFAYAQQKRVFSAQ